MPSPQPATRPPLPLGKRLVFVGIVLVFFLALVEIGGWAACRFLTTKLVFYPPDRGDFAEYLRIHDPVLGWPAPARFEEEGRDTVGARVSPAFPDRVASPPAISCYGDSFTWSAEVEDADAWPEVLSTLIGARVDNFGVGGYGSDQALLRFRQNAESGIDTARVVVLAHLTENIIRNLNQFRGLIYAGNGGLGFKPRFILGPDGGLELVPLTIPAPEQYDAFIRDPNTLLRHETFAVGSAEGPRRARFPFALSAAAAFTHPRMTAFFSGLPHYTRFYDPAHHAHGAQLTGAIMEAFWRETQDQGRIGVPVIIPTGLDIEYFRKTGKWAYQPLVDDLASRGVPVLDLGPIIEERSRGGALSEYFAQADISRHFSAKGYRLVAEAVRERVAAFGPSDAPAQEHAP